MDVFGSYLSDNEAAFVRSFSLGMNASLMKGEEMPGPSARDHAFVFSLWTSLMVSFGHYASPYNVRDDDRDEYGRQPLQTLVHLLPSDDADALAEMAARLSRWDVTLGDAYDALFSEGSLCLSGRQVLALALAPVVRGRVLASFLTLCTPFPRDDAPLDIPLHGFFANRTSSIKVSRALGEVIEDVTWVACGAGANGTGVVASVTVTLGEYSGLCAHVFTETGQEMMPLPLSKDVLEVADSHLRGQLANVVPGAVRDVPPPSLTPPLEHWRLPQADGVSGTSPHETTEPAHVVHRDGRLCIRISDVFRPDRLKRFGGRWSNPDEFIPVLDATILLNALRGVTSEATSRELQDLITEVSVMAPVDIVRHDPSSTERAPEGVPLVPHEVRRDTDGTCDVIIRQGLTEHVVRAEDSSRAISDAVFTLTKATTRMGGGAGSELRSTPSPVPTLVAKDVYSVCIYPLNAPVVSCIAICEAADGTLKLLFGNCFACGSDLKVTTPYGNTVTVPFVSDARLPQPMKVMYGAPGEALEVPFYPPQFPTSAPCGCVLIASRETGVVTHVAPMEFKAPFTAIPLPERRFTADKYPMVPCGRYLVCITSG